MEQNKKGAKISRNIFKKLVGLMKKNNREKEWMNTTMNCNCTDRGCVSIITNHPAIA
jgi:hypothetical protein